MEEGGGGDRNGRTEGSGYEEERGLKVKEKKDDSCFCMYNESEREMSGRCSVTEQRTSGRGERERGGL